MWQQWVNIALGVLIIAVPFIEMSSAVFFWSLIILGAAIALLAAWGVQDTNAERSHGRMAHAR